MKNQKGITLIALVITIIVLLILAGITIAMLTGDNGLLTKSKESAAASAVAGAKDEVSLEFQNEMAAYLQDKYTAGATETAPTAQSVLNALANSTTDVSSTTLHECTVALVDGKLLITYPSSKTAKTNADYWAEGTINSTNLTLDWTNK
ncbi:MAG: prepilin-type N-terminal cleavage/methylation domain-containing protein [Clostridia bacterium]|nr:prepilin-type N-terminal cleavage/methylation domain-containing protein [Clostridia bacterium]